MNNSKENQQYRSIDLIYLFIIVLFIISFSYAFFVRSEKSFVKTTKNKAESLAYQILQLSKSNQQRKPASQADTFGLKDKDGEISKDPWGAPFNYFIVKNKMGSPTHIVVWSTGPDKEKNAPYTELTHQTEFIGDDIGVIIPVSF